VKLAENSQYYEYSGVLHIHSRYSDGSGTIEKITRAAKKAGLDYIIVTDHNTLKAMEDGAEGWHDDLLVLVGEEIGDHEGNHCLAFGISDPIKPRDHGQDAGRYIEAVRCQGGIVFAAHPQGLHNTSFDLHLSPWDAWDDPDYTGLEVWSYMCDWVESVTWLNILYYYLRPEKVIHGPSPDVLQKWDQLCQVRRVVGIGGSDAHARHLSPFNFIKFLSYKRTFHRLRTHLLTPSPLSPDLDESKRLIYTALGSGHCFFANDFLADSTGFNFKASTDEGQMLLMGDEARLRSAAELFEKKLEQKFPPDCNCLGLFQRLAELEVTSPVPASLRLVHNGQLVKEVSEARQLTWKASEPGVYRVEARYNGNPWVFTNPIYLTG